MLAVKVLAISNEGRFFTPFYQQPVESVVIEGVCKNYSNAIGPTLFPHETPCETCFCGVHGLFSVLELLEYMSLNWWAGFSTDRRKAVLALVEAGGNTIIGEKGLRANHVEIVGVAPIEDNAVPRGYLDKLDFFTQANYASRFFRVPSLDWKEIERNLADEHRKRSQESKIT